MATMFQIIQFLDGNGDPYDSGAVFWYEAGTSTPKDTWVDEAESAPAANPVLLDSDGRPDHGSGPAAMWLRGSYKMVLKTGPNPTDPTIITVDYINLYDQIYFTGLTATIADLNSTSTVALLKTTTYTIAIADRGKTILADASGGAFTINLPPAAIAGDKFKVIIKKIDNSINAVTIDPNASETIDTRTTYLLYDYFDFIEVHCDGSNWFVVSSQIRGTIRTVTSVTTLTIDDNNKVINADATGGAFAINLPSAITVGKGWSVTVKKIDSSSNGIALTPIGGQTIDDIASALLATQYFALTIKSDGAAYFSISEFASVTAAGGLPLGYIYGFPIEVDAGDIQHDIKIGEGIGRGTNNLTNMSIGAVGLIKKIDASWAAGNNAGGFPTGISLSSNVIYHCFVIATAAGETDGGFDTSISASNLLADATGYVDYLRIGSFYTNGSSNIEAFQTLYSLGKSRYFQYKSPLLIFTGQPPTTPTLITAPVPTGIITKAVGMIIIESAPYIPANATYNIYSTFENARPGFQIYDSQGSLHGGGAQFHVFTDVNREFYFYQTGSSTGVTAELYLYGWEE